MTKTKFARKSIIFSKKWGEMLLFCYKTDFFVIFGFYAKTFFVELIYDLFYQALKFFDPKTKNDKKN